MKTTSKANINKTEMIETKEEIQLEIEERRRLKKEERLKCIKELYKLETKTMSMDKYIEMMLQGVNFNYRMKLINELKFFKEIAYIFKFAKELPDPRERFAELFRYSNLPYLATSIIIQDIAFTKELRKERDFSYTEPLFISIADRMDDMALIYPLSSEINYPHYLKFYTHLGLNDCDFVYLYGKITEKRRVKRSHGGLYACNSSLRSFIESDRSIIINKFSEKKELCTLVITNIICKYIDDKMEIYDRSTGKWNKIDLVTIEENENQIAKMQKIRFTHTELTELREAIGSTLKLDAFESTLNKLFINDKNYAKVNRMLRIQLTNQRPELLNYYNLSIYSCDDRIDRLVIRYSLVSKPMMGKTHEVNDDEKGEMALFLGGELRHCIEGVTTIFKEELVKYKDRVELIPVDRDLRLRLRDYQAEQTRYSFKLNLDLSLEDGNLLRYCKPALDGEDYKTFENGTKITKKVGSKIQRPKRAKRVITKIEEKETRSKVEYEGSWFKEEDSLEIDIEVPIYYKTQRNTFKDLRLESPEPNTIEHYKYSKFMLVLQSWNSMRNKIDKSTYTFQLIHDKRPLILFQDQWGKDEFYYSLIPNANLIKYQDRKFLLYRIGDLYLLYSYDISIMTPKLKVSSKIVNINKLSLLNFCNSTKQIQYLYYSDEIDLEGLELLKLMNNEPPKIGMYKDLCNEPIHFKTLLKNLTFIPYKKKSSVSGILPGDFKWDKGMCLGIVIYLPLNQVDLAYLIEDSKELDEEFQLEYGKEKTFDGGRQTICIEETEGTLTLNVRLNSDDIFSQHHDIIQFIIETFLGQGEIVIPGTNPRDGIVDLNGKRRIIEIKTSLSKYRAISKLMTESYIGYEKLGCVSDGLMLSEELIPLFNETKLYYEDMELGLSLMDILQEVNYQYVLYRTAFPQLVKFSIQKLSLKNDIMGLIKKTSTVDLTKIDYIKETYEPPKLKKEEPKDKKDPMAFLDNLLAKKSFDYFKPKLDAKRETKYVKKENIAYSERINVAEKFKYDEEKLENIFEIMDLKIMSKNGFELTLADDFDDEDDLFAFGDSFSDDEDNYEEGDSDDVMNWY